MTMLDKTAWLKARRSSVLAFIFPCYECDEYDVLSHPLNMEFCMGALLDSLERYVNYNMLMT